MEHKKDDYHIARQIWGEKFVKKEKEPLGHALYPLPGVFRVPELFFTGGR